MKESFIGLGIVLLLVLGGFAVKVIFFPVHTAKNMVNLAYDAQDKTLDANNAIYNYEWFKQQKEDIDALGNKYKNAEESYQSYLETIDGAKTFEDKTEIARLNTVKLGIKNQLEQAIANYNARSKMANRNIFEDSILPGYIDSLTFITK